MITRNSKDKGFPSVAGPKIKRPRLYAALLALVFLSLSAFYLRFSWNRYRNIASSEAFMLAQSMESLLHPEHISELSGSAGDLDKPAYMLTKSSLMRLVDTTNPIRFAYLLAEHDGGLVILVDSEPPESASYSPPGQVYTEADDFIWEPFRSGKTVLTPPNTDRWGTWISALVPITDPANGHVIAVFGIDYDAAAWYANLWGRMVPDMIIVFCLLLFFFALLRLLFQQYRLKKLRSEEHTSELQSLREIG
jgi:hypothetical protein